MPTHYERVLHQRAINRKRLDAEARAAEKLRKEKARVRRAKALVRTIVPCARTREEGLSRRLPFKALATKQPFASLIAIGKKRIEYRSWSTKYRGPLVIIASSQPRREDARKYPKLAQPTSCLMALVDLVDVTGDRGSYEWHLENATPLVQTPYKKSRVMTFTLEADVVVRLA